MENEQLFESQHFLRVKEIAQNRLDLLKKEMEAKEKDILLAKAELTEETSHSISNLWASDNFEQLVELSQFATMISNDISSYEAAVKEKKQLELMLNSPYFARIDFQFENAADVEKFYIGRFSLMDGQDLMICDWRSPIASMFYRYGLGKAFYEAPVGKISGELRLKRQYEIKNGILEYFFDAELEILDEFLRKLLAQNASPQMKNIVETIQRDQDVVIRDMENDLLIVQGVAGSGKTSIALHRVAYLMYAGLANKLTSQSVVILSPHSLFEQYISNVLPELGEENVTSLLLDELFQNVLKSPKIQAKHQLFEAMMTGESNRVQIMKSSLEFKASKAFMRILDTLEPQKNKLADMIAAYNNLFCNRKSFVQFAKDAPLPEDIEDIILFTQENLQSSRLFFDDASALTYLYLKRNGYDTFRHIKQVVVDEAQDYYAIHFEIIKLLFPGARYTILGDIHQTIEKQESALFYEDIKSIFNKRKTALITLDKSFRCANEILQFSAKFVDADIKAFGRQSDTPQIYELKDEHDLSPLCMEIEHSIKAGYQSIGIICKSEKDCLKLYERLSAIMDVSLIKSASDANLSGVFILPVYLSKGLEFDVALIWDVDATHYATEADRKLLYIGCTRALHRLNLFYHGMVSPLCNPDS